MEADWEVEIGPDAPVIDALWTGFIDLKRTPERMGEIDETRKFPALAEVLLHLNRSESNLSLSADSGMDSLLDDVACGSQVWSSKCDLWTLDRSFDTWDPDELNATPVESSVALACYIDLLPRDTSLFAGLVETETWTRGAVGRLRKTVCRCCRADLVIRRAFKGDNEVLGITAYTTACGADSNAAEEALSSALHALVSAVRASASNSAQML
jgi:hypothetical protein